MTAPTACLKRAVLCCLLSIMAISTHSAANLFVDDDDPTCGSVLPCFSRIQAAIDAAHAGDTVRVRPGTYQENVSIRKDLDLSSTGGPGSTIIDGADGGASTILVYSDSLDVRTRISGFTIQHGSGITNFLEEGYGIAVYGFHHISVVIENNVIRDNNVSGGIGVFPVGPECVVTIAGNTVVHNGGLSGGVLVDSHYAGDYSATIANNVIAYNTAG